MLKKKAIIFLPLLLLILLSSPAWASTFSPFGPKGEGGSVNGQNFTIESSGAVNELDAFLNIAGLDLNGSNLGSSAQLSIDPLPAGLNYNFMAFLSSDTTDVRLNYSFFNDTGGALSDVQFFSFLDAEIGEPIFFDEYGATAGNIGSGANDANPDSWEIDEPGFLSGDIFDNLSLGSLDNTNTIPISSPDDVSMALGFNLGTLDPLDTAVIDILISEDGDALGSLSLIHKDIAENFNTVITMSGQSNVSPVPVPPTIILLGFGLIAGFLGIRKRTNFQ